MTVEFLISNTTAAMISFYLEPWGGRYPVAPGCTLRVVIEAPTSPVLEWEIAKDVQALVVRDPARATAIVYDGDNEILAE